VVFGLLCKPRKNQREPRRLPSDNHSLTGNGHPENRGRSRTCLCQKWAFVDLKWPKRPAGIRALRRYSGLLLVYLLKSARDGKQGR
jgi:hypothetical protein